jgi:hypothetical protein
MYSPALYSPLVKARVDELHRAAQTSASTEVNRSPATHLSALARRTINRVFPVGRWVSGEATAIHGFELFARDTTTIWRPRY